MYLYSLHSVLGGGLIKKHILRVILSVLRVKSTFVIAKSIFYTLNYLLNMISQAVTRKVNHLAREL